MKKNIFKKIKGGFTVVEAMVAISILLLSITGTFAIAQSSIQSTSFAKNRITAYYLAQEGIEYVRHLRDNNGLKMLGNRTDNISWLEGFAAAEGDPCFNGVPCMVDTTGETGVTACDEFSGCSTFYLNTETGKFEYTSKGPQSVPSTFRRTVTVVIPWGDYFLYPGDPTPGGQIEHQVMVRVVVDWDQNGINRSLEISENLYNWQQLQPLYE